jgi:hypothetical protein
MLSSTRLIKRSGKASSRFFFFGWLTSSAIAAKNAALNAAQKQSYTARERGYSTLN